MQALLNIKSAFNDFCRETRWTDNPVADAADYDDYMEYAHRKHVVGKCVCCGGEVCNYGEDYDFDGDLVCNECRFDYIDRYLIKEG